MKPEDVQLDVEGLQRALVEWLRRWELVDQEGANVALRLAMDEVFDEKENADLLALLRRVSGKGASVHELLKDALSVPVPAPPQLDIELAAVDWRVLDAIEEYGASDGLTDELEAAMHNLNLVIAALRRPTTQGTPEGQ